MPEVTELFDMVRRQAEPIDVEKEWDKLVERQHRMDRDRRVGALASSVALAAVVAAVFLLGGPNTLDRGQDDEPGRSGTIPSQPGVYLFDLETGRATRAAGDLPAHVEALSPDGTMIAYTVEVPGKPGREVISVANLDGTNARPLSETATSRVGPHGLQFSPDGSQIAYQVSAGGNDVGDLFLADVASGRTRRLTRLERVTSWIWRMGPSFSPDGETVFFTAPNGGPHRSWNLWSVPASGGKPKVVLRDVVGGRVSPDGRMIAYFTPTEDPFAHDLWVGGVDGSRPRRLATGDLTTLLSVSWSPDGTKIAYGRSDRGATYVVDVRTGRTTEVLEDAYSPIWLDRHTWIVGAPVP